METVHKYRDKVAGRTYTAHEYAQEHEKHYCCKHHAVSAYARMSAEAYDKNDKVLGAFYLAVAWEIQQGGQP